LTIFFADAAFRRGSIYAGLGEGGVDQLVVAIFGMLLTVLTVVAIAIRSRRRVLGTGIDSAVILVSYLAATAVIIARGIQF